MSEHKCDNFVSYRNCKSNCKEEALKCIVLNSKFYQANLDSIISTGRPIDRGLLYN